MTQVELIQSQIETLPYNEFARLRKWFSEKDWKEWDKQIGSDSSAGKPRVLGLHEGAIWMSGDFDEPLPDTFWLGTS